uniref:Uncharacterized protein n=1 Tax=Cucumis melo TaxID=3656 RepID=A0A9I9ECA1_CUCME
MRRTKQREINKSDLTSLWVSNFTVKAVDSCWFD